MPLVRLASLFTALIVASAMPVFGQPPARAATGGIEGFVSTQDGTVRLPGVVVTVTDTAGAQRAQQVSDGAGHFAFADLPPGGYVVTGALDGFRTVQVSATVRAGQQAPITLDLPIAAAERVEVTGSLPVGGGEVDTIGRSDAIDDREREELTPGGGFQAALRLLASAIEAPTGLSIKGGRPNQAGVQLGAGSLIDPSTGLVQLTLPADAVDSVAVLPNPYAVEFGRFSSGLIVIQTRRGGPQWRVRVNDIDPSFRTRRYRDFSVLGIQEFSPRIEFGGPVVKDRVFLQQSAQYTYIANDVPSRPEDELRISRWFSSFTRADVNLTPRHSLIATGGLFPRGTTDATLGTFMPPNATVDMRDNTTHASVTERALWSDALVSESTFRVQQYRTTAEPHGSAPMELRPETTLGNFFNYQSRTTRSFQWVDTVSSVYNGIGGQHLLKLGVDLFHSAYAGSSASRPLLIERTDGTLTRRLDFGPATRQNVHTTDVALFAQDRLQPSPRWYIEFGARLDRDGVFGQWNGTPRAGAAVLLDAAGRTVLRGGFGLFFERTPSAAGAFDQFESAFDTRYAPDGITPLGMPVQFAHALAANLRTSRSATWNADIEHRVGPSWSFHAAFLDRRGSNELVVDPEQAGAVGRMVLASTGRSRYRDLEFGAHYSHAQRMDVNATYVRSVARANLNAFSNYYGTVLWPILGTDAYAATNTDVPHRLLVRSRAMPTDRWLLLSIVDWRSGFPYSTVDAALDYVGPRNAFRFPSVFRLEVGVERRVHMAKWDPWIGVRVLNPFNGFWPTDVQANVTSPAFGTFYNSDYRRIRLVVRFQR